MYSLDPIYQTLSSVAQIHANLYLAHAIGMNETLIFNVLIAKSTWYINNNLSDDGWFYCTQNDLQKSTTFGEKTQRAAIKHLVEEKLIEYKVAGLPQRRFFRIINDNASLSRLLKKGMEAYNDFDKIPKSQKNSEISNSSQMAELETPIGGTNSSQTAELETPNGRNCSLPNGGTVHSQTEEFTYKRNKIKGIKKKESEEKETEENIIASEKSESETAPMKENHSTALSTYEEIINHLNEKAGTHFKATTTDTKRHINARLSEGYTTDDFFKVIDEKCQEWLGNEKMEQYLRPSTLFGVKFENYLNAALKSLKTENKTDKEKSTSIEEILAQYLQGGTGK